MPIVSLRRVCCTVALLAGTVVPASAFDYPIHIDITRAALAAVIDNLARSPEGQTAREDLSRAAGTRVTTFTPKAIQEITDANKAQDTDDCGNKEDRTIPAQPCDTGPNGRGSAVYHLLNEPPWEHFDAEAIQQSSDAILNARREIVALLKRGNFIGARKRLGHALHAIQDFYSHTNYVEMGYSAIDLRIGAALGSFSAAGTKPRLAGKEEEVCLLGEYLFTNDLKKKFLDELKVTISKGRKLGPPICQLAAPPMASRASRTSSASSRRGLKRQSSVLSASFSAATGLNAEV